MEHHQTLWFATEPLQDLAKLEEFCALACKPAVEGKMQRQQTSLLLL